MNDPNYTSKDLSLVKNLFVMNLKDRHLGSMLGITWAIMQPLMTLMVYTFVFGFLMKSRAPGAETTLDYVIWMICGLGPWIAISEAIVSGSNSIWTNSNLIKSVPMKKELVVISSVAVSIVPLLVTMVFVFVLMIYQGTYPSWHAVYLLPCIFLQYIFVICVTIYLSPLVLFIRDLTHVIPNLLMLAMFLTPIFYSIERVPGIYKQITACNPIYIITDGYRAALIRSESPSFFPLFGIFVLASVALCMGIKIFRKLQGHFDSAL